MTSFFEIAAPPDGHLVNVGDASCTFDDEFSAVPEEAVPDRGRIAAVSLTSEIVVWWAKRARRSSGAVETSARIWLMVAVL